MGCGYFDLIAFMGGPLSMVDWVAANPPHGARDHIHLTRHGYQRLAEEFHAALLEGYEAPASDVGAAEPAPDAEEGGTAAPSADSSSSSR